jgi:hypothetical protein
MAEKKAKKTAVKPEAVPPAKPAGAQPKKKKKNPPNRPQPAWLFPPDEENPVLNPKVKSSKDEKAATDDRLAAIKFLQHKVSKTPVKTAPPSELLQLVAAFLDSYGFESSGRLFTQERNQKRKLEAWKDDVGTKKLPKGMPDLVQIYKDWKADWRGASDEETSSDESESGASEEQKTKSDRKSTDESSSGEDSGSDTESSEDEKPKSKKDQNTTTKSARKAKSMSPSSSSSESESDDASTSKAKADATNSESESDSAESSQSDNSDTGSSDSEAESKKTANKITSSVSEKPSQATLVSVKEGSDSSVTLKGNSPPKQFSPAVASSSSSSSSGSSSSAESESDSDSASESDSNSASKSTPQQPSQLPKTASTTSKQSKKRKAPSSSSSSSSSSSASEDENEEKAKEKSPPSSSTSDANNVSQHPSKKAKISNAPFQRIPSDTKVDPRLASNKYVPYDYAERAHQDLIVTKGKGFTKEKNKKKRGS